jgi:hypothetical protein
MSKPANLTSRQAEAAVKRYLARPEPSADRLLPRLYAKDLQPNAYRGKALLNLPPHIRIIWPPDGGFWLMDTRKWARIRRIDLDDLKKDALRHGQGKGNTADEAD